MLEKQDIEGLDRFRPRSPRPTASEISGNIPQTLLELTTEPAELDRKRLNG